MWTLRWQTALNSGIVAAAAVAPDGSIFISSAINTMYALSRSGVILWVSDMTRAGALYMVGAPVLSADSSTVYVASAFGDVIAFVAQTGQRLWSHSAAQDFQDHQRSS